MPRKNRRLKELSVLKNKLIIGSRGSRLALWQSEHVADLLRKTFPALNVEIKIIQTTGDSLLDIALSKIGDKGLFTKQIEDELLNGAIDLAVHSLKDLPTQLPENLKIGAVTEREVPNDALISKKSFSIAELPQKAKIATGSLRRKSQLLALRPDLDIHEIRGNVPTRLKKFEESELDAMILAFAGLHRLKLDAYIKQMIPVDEMLPAVAQGVIGIEIRDDDARVENAVRQINDAETEIRICAERNFLRNLNGGCQVPIGAFATLIGDQITLEGFVGNLDGVNNLRGKISGDKTEAEFLGEKLARELIVRGANEILQRTREQSELKREDVI